MSSCPTSRRYSHTRSTYYAPHVRASVEDSNMAAAPLMHRAIAAAKYVFRMDMADWLADNLSEAREWLCADDSAAGLETLHALRTGLRRKPAAQQLARVTQREALTRKVVRGLYVSDARLRQPLGPNARRFLRSHHHRLLHRRDLSRSARVPPLPAQRHLDAAARRHIHHPRVAPVHGVQVRRPHVPGLQPVHRRHAGCDAREWLRADPASTCR